MALIMTSLVPIAAILASCSLAEPPLYVSTIAKDVKAILSEQWKVTHDRGIVVFKYQGKVTCLSGYPRFRMPDETQDEYIKDMGNKSYCMITIRLVRRLPDNFYRKYFALREQLAKEALGPGGSRARVADADNVRNNLAMPTYYNEGHAFFVWRSVNSPAEIVRPLSVREEVQAIFKYLDSKLARYEWQ